MNTGDTDEEECGGANIWEKFFLTDKLQVVAAVGVGDFISANIVLGISAGRLNGQRRLFGKGDQVEKERIGPLRH